MLFPSSSSNLTDPSELFDFSSFPGDLWILCAMSFQVPKIWHAWTMIDIYLNYERCKFTGFYDLYTFELPKCSNLALNDSKLHLSSNYLITSPISNLNFWGKGFWNKKSQAANRVIVNSQVKAEPISSMRVTTIGKTNAVYVYLTGIWLHQCHSFVLVVF